MGLRQVEMEQSRCDQEGRANTHIGIMAISHVKLHDPALGLSTGAQ